MKELLEPIVTFEDEVEARLLSRELDARGIPHVLRSFYDPALDGVYQQAKGWGRLDAPAQFKEAILAAYAEIKHAEALPDDDEGCEAAAEEPAAEPGRRDEGAPFGWGTAIVIIAVLLLILICIALRIQSLESRDILRHIYHGNAHWY